MRKLLAAAMTLALLSLTLHADAQQFEPQNCREIWELKNSKTVEGEYDRRNEYLDAEIESGGGPDWAGEYYRGDGLGLNITVRIAPQGGFTFVSAGCLGVYDRNYGAVVEVGGKLSLDYELPSCECACRRLPRVFVPVRWGERRYLLAESELGDFVNAVNSGFEPCEGLCPAFLRRNRDDESEVFGQPDLPGEYL